MILSSGHLLYAEDIYFVLSLPLNISYAHNPASVSLSSSDRTVFLERKWEFQKTVNRYCVSSRENTAAYRGENILLAVQIEGHIYLFSRKITRVSFPSEGVV
ncbi:hypothetical protein PROFUN_08699 [Planoprotostelium fungivorum]|uniref:Uncharacterized protein n=1 Tax=Planoprotostelium fungivorum TaxID=1890364 RepID=A0A2P6MQU9_9EUKA|nr:hypothetical protein PROFUN_08699 [Planoprotostelium fungivorum]